MTPRTAVQRVAQSPQRPGEIVTTMCICGFIVSERHIHQQNPSVCWIENWSNHCRSHIHKYVLQRMGVQRCHCCWCLELMVLFVNPLVEISSVQRTMTPVEPGIKQHVPR